MIYKYLNCFFKMQAKLISVKNIYHLKNTNIFKASVQDQPMWGKFFYFNVILYSCENQNFSITNTFM